MFISVKSILTTLILIVFLPFITGAQKSERFESNNKFGIKDAAGKIIVAAKYDNIILHEAAKGWVAIVNNGAKIGEYSSRYGGKYGVIDASGKLIIAEKYDFIQILGDGLFGVSTGGEQPDGDMYSGGKWGLVDMEGKLIVPVGYDRIWPFDFGFARVVKAGKHGFINRKGKVVVPIKYDNVFPFEEVGIACVELNEMQGYVDSTGKTVIPLVYEKISFYESDNLFAANKAGKWGFVNMKNETVIPFRYDDHKGISEGLIAVNVGAKYASPDEMYPTGGKWGYIDLKGKEVIPVQLDNAFGFRGGKADVVKDGKKLKIDRTGVEVK